LNRSQNNNWALILSAIILDDSFMYHGTIFEIGLDGSLYSNEDDLNVSTFFVKHIFFILIN
jgi:hypothetical protein